MLLLRYFSQGRTSVCRARLKFGTKGWFVCVNITTKRENSDTTCELFQGEHQELASPISVVVYSHAREIPAPLIERLTQQQKLPRISESLLSRIQRSSLTDTSRMKKKFQNAIRTQLEI